MNEIAIDIDLKEIEISDIASDEFDIEKSISEAEMKLQDIAVQERAIGELRFENEIWVFEDPLKGSKVLLKFNDIEESVVFNKEIDISNFISIIKCWTVQFFDNHYALTVRDCLNNLKRVIEMTNGFHRDFTNTLYEKLYTSNKTEVHTARTIDIIFNFLDYAQIDTGIAYFNELSDLYRKLNKEHGIRKIPSSKDVMLFAYKLNEWFLEAKKKEDSEFLTFYPLVMWFNLTTIIPMRPSEFCAIKRNALTKVGEKHYIKLPRKKQRKSTNVQIVDEFLISSELYNLIVDYIRLTEGYGHSDTLISYRAIKTGKRKKQTNHSVFTTSTFYYLLNRFYIDIIQGRYGLTVKEENEESESTSYDIERKLRPNDTRHIAFISLMLQGYDQVEIARLGGHTSLTAQHSYFSHMEFWVDSEVQRLSENFESVIKNLHNDIHHPEAISLFDRLIDKSWIEEDCGNNHYEKLSLGICSDEAMACPTFDDLYSGCYFCRHWRISLHELEENKELILKELSETYYGLKDSIAYLSQVYKENDLNEIGEINQNIKNDIKQTSKLINSQIYRISALGFMFGGLFDDAKRTQEKGIR